MILVTGTKRSGTSLWMQIFKAAGFPIIGKPFISNWDKSIKSANLNGFYESRFRQGVYYATNPEPSSGTYLFPHQTRQHVLKVFVPGLIKTDSAFIDHVVATIRPWREFCTSLQRLYNLEDAYLSDKESSSGIGPLELARLRRGDLHPALEWWRCNFDLIRDFATRRYAFNLVSYSTLMSSPEKVITDVLKWCGCGDVEAAIKVVDPVLRTQKDVSLESVPIDDKTASLFDEFHSYFLDGKSLTSSFISKLNDLDLLLSPRIISQRRKDFHALRTRLLEAGMIPHEIDSEVERMKNDAPWGPED